MSDVSEIASGLVRRANEARDAGRFDRAAGLYAEALRFLPRRADLHVQHGHVLKETGDHIGAEGAYRLAEAQMPNDPDLALQFGHLFKSAGRLDQAISSYRKALTLKPGWALPRQELDRLSTLGWRTDGEQQIVSECPSRSVVDSLSRDALAIGVAPALVARPMLELLHNHHEGIEYRRLGRSEYTHWGNKPVLRGVEAVRGFVISGTPVLTIELILGGQLIYRGGVKGGYPLPSERDNVHLKKYVFNIWIDLGGFGSGQYELGCRAIDIDNGVLARSDPIFMARPLSPTLLPDRDGSIDPPDPSDRRPLQDQINGRPSMVRAGGRALLCRPPRAVLVQRADQLGDLVVSVPAIRRLREMFPDALLIGLVSKSNEKLAKTFRLFDRLVTVDFPTSEIERRRTMSIRDQEALASELQQYEIELAIDLSEAESSRLLLPLSGSPVTVGFRTAALDGLDVDMSVMTYDKHNSHETVPHARKAQALVEWLNLVLDTKRNLAIREDLDRSKLTSFGLPEGARYVILHAGARARFSRWPYYSELAGLILARTELHVLLMTANLPAGSLPTSLTGSNRFKLIDGEIDFDDFDALISFCAVFVGDDSGPKHLASLRGAKVVGVQTARNHWNEWGQDSGRIVTRRVPCAGCIIQTDLEAQECGKDVVCLTAITADEVFDAMAELLDHE